MSTKFGLRIDFDLHAIIKYETGNSIEPPRPPSWNCTQRHYSAAGRPIWMKFIRLVQNDMPTAVIWSKSKPEVKIHYGGRLFFQTGSSYISAVDSDMPMLLIDVDLRKRVISSNIKPEVVWSRRGRHLEIVHEVITPSRVARFGRNMGTWFRIAHKLLRSG